jgi:hypothetical protein
MVGAGLCSDQRAAADLRRSNGDGHGDCAVVADDGGGTGIGPLWTPRMLVGPPGVDVTRGVSVFEDARMASSMMAEDGCGGRGDAAAADGYEL